MNGAGKTAVKGFLFGMLLQIAVGPVCVYVFNTSVNRGPAAGAAAVAAVVLVDALYIVLAGFGLATFMDSAAVRKRLKLGGGIVVAVFGLDIFLAALGRGFLPGLGISPSGSAGPFLSAFLLTLSNPLTIVFWAGVFTARVREDEAGKGELALFAAGAVGATLVFLGAVACIGAAAGIFLPGGFIRLLNGAVGIVLAGFGVKMSAEARSTSSRTAAEHGDDSGGRSA